MGKHDNTAINALVHHAAGGHRRPAMLPARPIEVDRDSMPTIARGVQPAQLRRPMNAGAYRALPTTPRESADPLPTMALAPAQVYRRALPYAATEQVQNLAQASAYRAMHGGEAAVPTAQMYAHAQPAPGARSFLVELAYTLKEFALPIGVLMVLAVACGVYLASGHGGKKAAPVTSVAAPAPAPTPRSSLSGAVLAADPSLAPAEKVAPVVEQPVVQPVVAPPAPVVVEAAPVAEIEMTPATATRSKKRSARSHRDHARPTRVAVAEVPVKKARRASSVNEAELPPNVADKTHGGPGKLVITSNKPALIYLDGRATGLTAPKKFTVPAGDHKVTLLDPETRKAKTQDVEIVAGKVATLDKQFK
jgi:hypothetical protein